MDKKTIESTKVYISTLLDQVHNNLENIEKGVLVDMLRMDTSLNVEKIQEELKKLEAKAYASYNI